MQGQLVIRREIQPCFIIAIAILIVVVVIIVDVVIIIMNTIHGTRRSTGERNHQHQHYQ